MDRLQVALISLCLGWGLAQLTEFIKNKSKIKKLKKAVSTELSDLEILLTERKSTAKNSALQYGQNGNYSCSLGAPISSPVLDAYYHEVAESFTDEQRYNIRVFRDHVRAYNSIVEWVERLGSKSATQNEVVFKLFEAYKQSAFAHEYIKAANSVGGYQKIGDDHEALEALREDFKKLTPQLAWKSS